jgi:Na+/proline symporter
LTLIGFSIIALIVATMIIGIRTYTKIKGHATNYYMAGNSMPVWVIGITLCAQAFDANGSMGNASLSFESSFWAGAAIPIGLASCLFLTGTFFAKPIHRMHLMTLADFYHRRYSQTTETLAALAMFVSNIILVAGNLAGLGLLLDQVFGGGYLAMLIIIGACILTYAVTGGLYATITTSVLQVGMFVLATIVGFLWLVGAHGWTELMSKVPAEATNLSGLLSPENNAYVNWAALVSLALGDVVAIDFIQRVISADSPQTARRGCYVGGFLTLGVGLLVSFIGLFAFSFDKEPSRFLLVDLSMNDMPAVVGTAILLGVIAASMSTAAGVVLDLANVITRNLVQRHTKSALEEAGLQTEPSSIFAIATVVTWNDHTMLRFSRWIALPTMAVSIAFAYLRPEPGILLILAFDIVLAGCFIPLALGIYWKRSNTPGAIAAIIIGTLTRVALYFLIPEPYAGLDTLIPPIVSLVAFVSVSLMTQKTSKPKHEALTYVPTDEELVKGIY